MNLAVNQHLACISCQLSRLLRIFVLSIACLQVSTPTESHLVWSGLRQVLAWELLRRTKLPWSRAKMAGTRADR
jgi:hypothetical protein